MNKRQMKKREKKEALKNASVAPKVLTDQELEQNIRSFYTDYYCRSQSDKEKKFVLGLMRDTLYGIKNAKPEELEQAKRTAGKDTFLAACNLSAIGARARTNKTMANVLRILLTIAAFSASIVAGCKDERRSQQNYQALMAAFLGAGYWQHKKYRKLPDYPSKMVMER